MPYIRIVHLDTFDRVSYEAVSAALDLDHRHPLGLLMHAAGEVDGRWQIVNVWESQEYAEQFDQESLRPTMNRLIDDGFTRREITGYEVQHLVTP
jgi:hypothetical protein